MSKKSSAAVLDCLKESARGSVPNSSHCLVEKGGDPPTGDTHGTESGSDPEPTLRQITMQFLEVNYIPKIEEAKIDVGLLCQDLQNLRGRVREVKDYVSQLEDSTTHIPSKVAVLKKRQQIHGCRGRTTL